MRRSRSYDTYVRMHTQKKTSCGDAFGPSPRQRPRADPGRPWVLFPSLHFFPGSVALRPWRLCGPVPAEVLFYRTRQLAFFLGGEAIKFVVWLRMR